MMDPKVKKLTQRAYHEAGHAVARIRLGLPFRHITIIPDDEKENLGHVCSGPLLVFFQPDCDSRELAEDHVIALLAGLLAEKRWTGVFNIFGAQGDMRQIMTLISYFATGEESQAYYAFLLDRAKMFVQNEINLAGIRAIVEELLARERITDKEARRIFDESTRRLTDHSRGKWVDARDESEEEVPEATPDAVVTATE
jgi:ATP-dependent Zn protease